MSSEKLMSLHDDIVRRIGEINEEIIFLELDKEDNEYKLMQIEREISLEDYEDGNIF